jgi:type III pantothenate kinase
MSGASSPGLLAIDVGTSRVKLGWFPDAMACDSDKPSQLPIAAPRLPEPVETFAVQHQGVPEDAFRNQLAALLEPFDELWTRVGVAHVDAQVLGVVFGQLRNCQRIAVPQMLEVLGLPIKLAVRQPHLLGIDRALATIAVNRIQLPETPAIIISLGTACTVNLISGDGVFLGGAILPGLGMAGEALHIGTTSLPMISPDDWVLPDNAVGKNTSEAIAAGVFWGTVGAIDRLIQEQQRALATKPQLFLTGGDAPHVVDALNDAGHAVRLIPHLVLSGIAIACEARS